MGKVKQLVVETFNEWSNDGAMRLAAALAYYTLFSLAPLLLLLVRIVGLIWGNSEGQTAILDQVEYATGTEVRKTLEGILQSAARNDIGIVGAIAGLITLLLGASGLFLELQDALNLVWDAPPPRRTGWRALLRQRLVSFGLVLGTGVFLSLWLGLSAGLGAAAEQLGSIIGAPPLVLQTWNNLLSFALVTLVLMLVLKMVPDVPIAWGDVWIGAIVTAGLILAGKTGIAFYLAHSNVASGFGAAGSVIAVLVWIYYSSAIFFLGAEFTQVYARRHGTLQERRVARAGA